jgi:hypothetical protein
MRKPFGFFNSSPEIIRLAVMMYARYHLSLRQVEDLLFERGIDISTTKPFDSSGTGSARWRQFCGVASAGVQGSVV